MPKIITDPKTGKYGYYKDGIWNGLYINKGKIYRDRVECLIIDNNQVFLEFKSDGSYRLPGGSTELEVSDEEQVKNECKEEARIVIDTPRYISEYIETNIKPNYLKEFDYSGYRTKVYVSNFVSVYKDKIPEELQEKSMVKNGKFYDIDKVFFKLKPVHRDAIKEFREDPVTEGKISQEDRDKLKPSDFGIPELRKYPLIDKSHVLMAIRYFDKAPEEYKEELAHNIYSKSKKFKMNINKDSKWYSYVNEAVTEGKTVEWDETFYPCYTPKEMLELGVFEGKYLNDDKDEYPSSWFKNAKMSTKADESLNKYKIKSRQSLQVWKANGWINKQDPKGWFQWYCRYYNGRRSSDDKRQINRWRSFVSRHMGQIKSNCKLDDDDCRPKQRQGLLQWAWDSSKKFDDPSVIENNLKKMKGSASVVKEGTFFQATEYNSLSEMVLAEGYLNSIRHIRDYLDSYIVEVDCTKMSMSEIESLTEDTRLSGYKPVYIVLTDTGSLMSRMIKKVTGSAFNHSSIAFDESLSQLYSFGLGDTGSVPMFSIESKDNTYLKRYKKVPSQVYAVFVTNEQYTAMKYKVNEFVKNKKKYRYNWVGLLGYMLNKPIEISNKMFCSEFVDNMFKFVDIDLTGKAPGLVEPFDFAKSKSKQIYKVFDDSLDKYKPEEIRKRTKFALSEYLKSFELAKVVGESTILNETKHFPVQFDKEGNLIIKNLRKLDFEQEYQQSHKLLLVYSKNKNYEGMKYELSKLWFLNNVLEQEIYNNESPERKNKIKLRARILNDFNKYLKEVTSKDTGFNFTEYYNNTPFSDNEIVVSKNTVRGTVQLVKSIFL